MNTTTMAANESVLIPLNRLRKSDQNVRKAKVDGDYRKRLKASLLAQGLLENLIVAPDKHKANFFEVVGGGNRLELLQELVAEKAITADFPVPCVVKSREALVELSLSENIHAPMHPADEFEGYRDLAGAGLTAKEIARRFGQSEKKVKKLLKLGSVAPAIIENFRAGKMDLDCVMAFTVSEDHERQLACWKEVSKGYRSPHGIRSFLLEGALSSEDEIVQFVGLDRYRKAGGTITNDLFTSTSYVLDRVLLERLATEALESAAEPVKLEGWKWVEISFDANSAFRDCIQIVADLGAVPPELTTALAEKAQALETLEGKDWDALTEDESALMDQLGTDIETLEEQQDACRVFTADQLASAGCVVTIRGDGSLQVLRGLVKKEDRKLAAQACTQDRLALGEGSTSDDSRESPGLSSALRADLDTYYAQGFQAELMQHSELAYELLSFSLACNVLIDDGFGDVGMGLSCRARHHQAVGIDATPAAQAITQRQAELPVLWFEHETEIERFAAFRALGKKTIAEIVAFCVARMATARPGSEDDSPLRLVGQLMSFNLQKYWAATTENYFSRVKKDELLAIGEAVVGVEFKKRYSNCKKGDLVGVMGGLPALQGWLPAYLHQ